MKVQFYLAPKVHNDGEAPIRVSVSVHGTRLLTTCGASVKPEFWDDAAKKAKFPKGGTNSHGLTDKQLNALLHKIEADFDSYEAGLQGGYKPTIEELRDKLAESTGTGRKKIDSKREKAEKIALAKEKEILRLKRVSDYYQKFFTESSVKKSWSDGTIKKMASFGQKLADFDSLTELNSEDGIKKFHAKLKDSGLANRTIEKQFKLLKWFLRWCEDKGFIDKVCNFWPTIKIAPKDVIFLTPQELMKLYSFQIPDNGTKVTLHTAEGVAYEKVVEDAGALERVRDVFCFCAFSSLRYSDVAKLRYSDIAEDGIKVIQAKTDKLVRIELNQYSKAILDKYANFKNPFGLALPVISNQKYNAYLKPLCELAEINTLISQTYYRAGKKVTEVQPKFRLVGTHTARRTFVVNALSSGIPAEVVMRWTGHSDFQSMKPYVGILDSVKAASMQKFNDFLEGEK